MPIGPTEAELLAMSPRRRASLEDDLARAMTAAEDAEWEALTPQEQLDFTEGERHLDAMVEARDTLRAFYGRIGRSLDIAAVKPVLYPGVAAIRPDLIAVRDTDGRRRDAWIVAKEGKGVDLALEVLDKGHKRKDLVDNVNRYAQLGIAEYFVYDVGRGRLHAYQLSKPSAQPSAGPGARRYVPVLGNQGRYPSAVLDLELAVVGDRLRFYMGTAELSTTDEELIKLGQIAQQAREGAEREQERAEQACQGMAGGILALAKARGLPVAEPDAARIRATQDPELLSRWMERIIVISPEDLADGRLFLDS